MNSTNKSHLIRRANPPNQQNVVIPGPPPRYRFPIRINTMGWGPLTFGHNLCYDFLQVINPELNTPVDAPPEPSNASMDTGVMDIPFPLGDAPEVLTPCSWNSCPSGHRWIPVMVLVGCPGCSSQLLAVQNTQCPWCNEPCVRTSLRSDFLVEGAGVAPRCTGVVPPGDSLDIELLRTTWATAESNMKTFDQKTLEEDAAWAASHLSPVANPHCSPIV